jgi:hypothetical protein
MANLIRLKQIEGSTQLEAAISAGNAISQSGGNFQVAITNAVSASIQNSLSASITDIVSSSLNGALSLIATDVEVAAVSASIAATDSAISSSNYNLSSSVAQTFATQSSNLASVSSALNVFTSSIGLTIKQKLNTENVITSSRQLDNSIINNLTIGSTGDNYSLIVSGALAVVDADITISGSMYNVGGEIFVNGLTGTEGNPPQQPYDNNGNQQADVIDNGEF